ncbi:MAG: CocE/NonD family hydrolase [Marinoscillum sp.]
MKSFIFTCLILSLFLENGFTQTWSGAIHFEESSLHYQVKLVLEGNELRGYFSSIEMNAYEIPCQRTTLKNDSLHFYVFSDYYTYEYLYFKQEEGFLGKLKVFSNETEQLLNTFKTDLVREPLIASDIIEKKEVSFNSNNFKLFGTIWKPENPKNIGLLFVTSSQGNDRSGTNAEALHFAKLGYTVFNYDKRGTGKSEGDWQLSTIEDLCSDDMNAVEFFSQISSIPLIDIGIKGSSQGGIKIPYILAKMPNLGFGISVSCPSGTLLESDLNHWRNLNYEKVGESNIDQAVKVQKAGYDYLAGNISYQSLLDTENENSDKDWFGNVWIPKQDVQKDYKLNFSGLPYFRKITQPVLVIQGLSDNVIPEDSYRVIERALKKSDSKKYKVLTLENTNHSMTYLDKEFPYFQLLPRDYLIVINDWLEKIETR